MKKLLSILFILFIVNKFANAQGCVAIRSNGGVCTMSGPGHDDKHGDAQGWTIGINTRYFRSFRHFVGKEEQKQRLALGTEVINHSFSTELGLTRQFNDRWSFGFFAPLAANTRSSLYEHDTKNRYSTHSFGLGDVRVAAYYWLVNPARNGHFNVQAGLGLKLPTGDYRYRIIFIRRTARRCSVP